MSILQMKDRLIVALDVPTKEEALVLVKSLQSTVGAFKVGMQLYNSEGPDIVREIQQLGGKVFVDLKFHDIPNTVAQASRVMVRIKAFMCNMHASGGLKMMQKATEAAKEEAQALGVDKPITLAVTVLTSISQQVFEEEVGINRPIAEQVVRWAKMAQSAGLEGVVCSPWEITPIREACGENFIIVTPGVRPKWAAANDQERIMTPGEAIRQGASYLVVGRPITAQSDPAEAARRIVAEMEEAAGL